MSFSKVDAAEQAMARLQNFPIWGRPLRLAFANLQNPNPGSQARPATAPAKRAKDRQPDQKRWFNSGSVAAESGDGAQTADDASEGGSQSSHARRNNPDAVIQRLDRLLETAMRESTAARAGSRGDSQPQDKTKASAARPKQQASPARHASGPLSPPARSDGVGSGREVGQQPSRWVTQTAAFSDTSSDAAAQVRWPKCAASCSVCGERTDCVRRPEKSGLEADDKDLDVHGMSDISLSALSDVERGSELQLDSRVGSALSESENSAYETNRSARPHACGAQNLVLAGR